MSISAANPTTPTVPNSQVITNLNSSLGATGTSTLNESDFIKLLTAQLQNQDPLDPESDTDFIAQMASFSSLQQMQTLNQTFDESTANTYLGKTVTVTDPSSGTAVTGVVSQVFANSGDPQLTINGTNYDVSTVQSVSNTASSTIGSAPTLAAPAASSN
jgi:flagellar basal-body rod modification protein FlgD